MANNKRNVQFFRNSATISAFANHQLALEAADSKLQAIAQNPGLLDGEIVLYRYTITGNTQVHTIVGVVCENDDGKHIEILGNYDILNGKITSETATAISNAINALDGGATIASVNDGVVTLKSSIVQTDGTVSQGSGNDITLAKVATTGDYNDLTNLPTIPVVNNGTLTIKQGTTTLGEFTANQSTGTTIDIPVPTEQVQSDWNETNASSKSFILNKPNVATLDASGKVPTSQLPSYVDDVVEYVNSDAFPTTGESGKIYMDASSGDIYRWTGSQYLQISGIIGAQGEKGEQGTQGYQGFQGFQGYQGLQGEKGEQGEQGTQGYQGYQGFQGYQGLQGEKGEQGEIGTQGYQGLQGFQGFQGKSGVDGEQGEQGIQGFQGFQGYQGLQGTALTVVNDDKILTQTGTNVSSTLSLTYDSTNKLIKLLGVNNANLGTVDASNFIKDGMLESAELITNPTGQPVGDYIKLTFNTDAGKDPIYIEVTSLIDTYTSGNTNTLTVSGYTITPVTADVAANATGLAVAGDVHAKIAATKGQDIQTITGETATTQGNYINVKVSATKGENNNNYTLATTSNVTTQAVADATETNNGLSTAYDVKTYVDNKVGTTYTATGELEMSNGRVITHKTSGVTADTKGSVSGTTITVPTITVNAYGHVTALGEQSYTVTYPTSSVIAGDGIKLSTATSENNTAYTVEIKLNDNTNDMLTVDENGLNLSNVWDCGSYE